MPAPTYTRIDRTANPNDLLTTERAAEALGWTVNYFNIARTTGHLDLAPAVRRGPRNFYLRGDLFNAVDQLVAAREQTPCRIPGCTLKGRAGRDNLCAQHRTLVQIKGSADGVSGHPNLRKAHAPVERFKSFVRENVDGCHEWCGTIANGYGLFWVDRRPVRAHQAAFELVMERGVNAGFELDHQCENRRCVRLGEGHVVEATPEENRARALRTYYARKAAAQAAAEQQPAATVTRLWYTPADPAEYEQAA